MSRKLLSKKNTSIHCQVKPLFSGSWWGGRVCWSLSQQSLEADTHPGQIAALSYIYSNIYRQFSSCLSTMGKSERLRKSTGSNKETMKNPARKPSRSELHYLNKFDYTGCNPELYCYAVTLLFTVRSASALHSG